MRSIIKKAGLGAGLAAVLCVAALPEAMADDSAVQAIAQQMRSTAVAGIKAQARADLRHNARNMRYAYNPAPAPTYTADFGSPDLLTKLIEATPAQSLYRILPALTILSAAEAE